MTYFDEVFERIQRATNRRTQVALAELLEIRQSSISDAKRRNSVPADWYMKLFEKFGLNPDWLKKGVGPMYLRTEHGDYSPVDGPEHLVNENAAAYGNADARSSVVPVYSSHPGTDAKDGLKATGRLNVPLSYSFDGLSVIRMDSAANEPFIRKGAFVGLDTNVKHATSGEYFGILIPYEGLVVKKVFVDAQAGVLRLKSENPEHPEISLPLENCEESIVGKVSWALQRF